MEFPRDSERRDLSVIASMSGTFPPQVKRKDVSAVSLSSMGALLNRGVKEGRATVYPPRPQLFLSGFRKITIKSDPYRFLNLGGQTDSWGGGVLQSCAKIILPSECIRDAECFKK